MDQETIIEAGLRLASRPGAPLTLSFRDLGGELGVDPTAIYRHFHNKESLMQALLDRLSAMAVQAMEGHQGPWDRRLLDFATVTLDTFMRFPAIAVEATSITTNGPGERDSIELMLECFADGGLSGGALARQYAVFGAYVLAGAAGLASGTSKDGGLVADPWFSGPLLVDPARHPHLAAVRDEVLTLDHRDLFLEGVRQLIRAASPRFSAE